MRLPFVFGVGVGSFLAALFLVAEPARADDRVIELPELEPFVGVVQRPNAFYVLERAASGLQVVDLRTTFTDEILRDAVSVER